jgi:hypothetical protein
MKAIDTLLIFFLTAYLSNSIFAQNADHNHYKYWIYRNKLLDEFVVPGIADLNATSCYHEMSGGLSIPATEYIIGKEYPLYAYNKRYTFGDGTEQLGWYIAVLATEYELLRRSNFSQEEAKEELYYALEAFDRLDAMAENFDPYPSNNGCLRNGFFIRSDVKGGMVDPNVRAKWFPRFDGEERFMAYDPFNKRVPDSEMDSDCDYGTGIGCRNFMSKDQIADLFLGFAFVKKYLPNQNIPVYNKYGHLIHGGYNFRARVQEFTKRIMDYLYQNNFKVNVPQFPDQKVVWGYDARSMAYGLRRAAIWICDESNSAWFHFGIEQYSYAFWQATQSSILIGAPGEDYSYSIILSLAAIGSSWRQSLVWLPFIRRVLAINTTSLSLYTIGNALNKEIFALSHQVLHSKPNLFGPNVYRRILNSARCDGPRFQLSSSDFFDSKNVAPEGWRATNRFIKSDKIFTGDLESYYSGAYHFNGLDYMLLYNLFMLTRTNEIGMHVNSLYNDFDRNIPISSTYAAYGSREYPAWFYGFDYFRFANTMAWNSDVTVELDMPAKLDLLPGATIDIEAKFTAYHRVFSCDNNPDISNKKEFFPEDNYEDYSNDDLIDNVQDDIYIDSLRYYLSNHCGYSDKDIETILTSNSEDSLVIEASNCIKNMVSEYISTGYYPQKNTNRQNYNIILYPNPFTGEVTVGFDDSYEGLSAEVYDLSMRPVFTPVVLQNTTSIHKLNLAGLASGTYVLVIKQNGTVVKTSRIVKQ